MAQEWPYTEFVEYENRKLGSQSKTLSFCILRSLIFSLCVILIDELTSTIITESMIVIAAGTASMVERIVRKFTLTLVEH